MKYIIIFLLLNSLSCMQSIKNKKNTTNMPWVHHSPDPINQASNKINQTELIDYTTPYLAFSLIGALVFFIGFFPLFYAFYIYLKHILKNIKQKK